MKENQDIYPIKILMIIHYPNVYIYTPDYTSIYGYKVGPPVVLPIDPMKDSYIPHATNNVVRQLDAIRATGTPPCTLR